MPKPSTIGCTVPGTVFLRNDNRRRRHDDHREPLPPIVAKDTWHTAPDYASKAKHSSYCSLSRCNFKQMEIRLAATSLSIKRK